MICAIRRLGDNTLVVKFRVDDSGLEELEGAFWGKRKPTRRALVRHIRLCGVEASLRMVLGNLKLYNLGFYLATE